MLQIVILIVEFISIGIDQTVKHALGYKFFLLNVCELPKHFWVTYYCMHRAKMGTCYTCLLLVEFISIVIDQTCSWIPGFCGDCAQLLNFFEFVYA